MALPKDFQIEKTPDNFLITIDLDDLGLLGPPWQLLIMK